MMTDYLSSSNSPCNYEMAKENRKKSPRKESLVHLWRKLRPSLAAPFTGTLGISRHWQVGIGRPRQGSLLGCLQSLWGTAKLKNRAQGLFRTHFGVSFSFYIHTDRHTIELVRQKMCILRSRQARALSVLTLSWRSQTSPQDDSLWWTKSDLWSLKKI